MAGWSPSVTLGFCLALIQAIGGEEYLFSNLFRSVDYADPDSAGYRHCAYWRLADGTHLHSECDPFSMERCGQPAKFDYKCCAGFEDVQPTFMLYSKYRPATCSKMISPFDSCVETILQSPNYAAFAPVLSSVSELKTEDPEEPYTIFAPVLGDEQTPPLATEHVIRGRYYASDLRDGMELETLEGKSKLYVSKFSYGAIAIDCAEILEADLECQNGVIHKIRHPIGMRNGNSDLDRRSVLSLLRSHPDTKAFADDLPADLKSALSDVQAGRRYTVLAPRSQSWEALKRRYSGTKLQKIAASHVLKDHVCSGQLIRASNERASVRGDQVNIQCELDIQDMSERRYVVSECGERRSLVEVDMTASNGVVHIIDEPIIPLSVMTLDDLKNNDKCAAKLKITEFVKLLKECDLYIDPATYYAMVVPRDESFDWWSKYEQFREEYQRFQTDKEYRCKVARYHIMRSDGQMNNIDNFAGHTSGHRTNNRLDYLYETTYFTKTAKGSMLNFHYSPIPDMRSHEFDGFSMYFTTRINVPPEKNMTDILAERSDTKITYNKTVVARMEETHFRPNAPKNLYLVTTDDGWKDPSAKPGSASPYRVEYTMYKGESLEKYLLLHHVPLYLWGGDIGYFPHNSVHKFNSSAGVELTFWRDANGVMRIGHAELPRSEWPKVVKWNLHARDGIMWLLDGPIKCPESVCRLYVEDIDYYDMYVAACMTAHLPGEPNAGADFNKKPTEVAARHPSLCTVILQLSETSVSLIEA